MSKHALTIGTRGSTLALWQAGHIKERLQTGNPNLRLQLRKVKTRGDLVRDRALSQVGGRGLFVKEIENALLDREIDLAVHSLKDMPTELPGELSLGAILERADARDALVFRGGQQELSELPNGARVGTSSLRRRAQLLSERADLEILDLRGNVDTRLRKLYAGEYDAVVLAAAGLQRLGHAEAIGQSLPVEVMLPAVGQGALCVEVRAEDEDVRRLLAPLDHPPTRQAARAERAFLHRLEGGCQVPIAAYGQVDGNQLRLRGLVASPDGSRLVKDEFRGPANEAVRLGTELAEQLLDSGAREILEEIRRDG
jgi:hydroxymethylbilane synthase